MLVVLGIPILSAIFQTLRKFFETIFTTRVSYMLNVLDWQLLSVGRECQRLNFMCKSSHNLNGVALSKYVILSQSQTRRSHDMVFNHLSACLDTFRISFFPRTIPFWNDLLQEVVHSPYLAAFSSWVNAWRSCSVA